MLLFKLTLVPLLIASVTLIGRRWGARIAGMFAGLPVITGPIAFFLALEQGSDFAARAAVGAIAAVAALMVFMVAYAWTSRRVAWPAAAAAGLLAWFGAAALIARLPMRIDIAMPMALGALLVAPWVLPAPEPLARPPATASRLDLPGRMLAGAALVLFVTTVAAAVGEAWSGLLAVFPVITLVLGVSTHRQAGSGQVNLLYRGMSVGLYSFCAFLAALSWLLPRTGIGLAFTASVAVALLVQALAGAWSARR